METYYPTYYLGCNPIHPVISWSKVRKLIRDARRGDSIPPILIDGDFGNCNLLSGTHRAAANDIMMMLADRDGLGVPDCLIDVVTVDELERAGYLTDELKAAIDDGDFERIGDLMN